MLLIVFLAVGGAFALPTMEAPDTDSESSRKVLGSSVVTSVSVIMDTGNGTKAVYTDAVGKPVPKPTMASQLASPINLLNPDRYEFYTFDDSGDLVKRLMTLDEIQGIIASGDGDGMNYNQQSPDGEPENKVNDIVSNVQNVLKEEIESHKNSDTPPPYDTPDVSSTWSMILPAIFGNTGETIKPDRPLPVVTADTIMIEPTEPSANQIAKDSTTEEQKLETVVLITKKPKPESSTESEKSETIIILTRKPETPSSNVDLQAESREPTQTQKPTTPQIPQKLSTLTYKPSTHTNQQLEYTYKPSAYTQEQSTHTQRPLTQSYKPTTLKQKPVAFYKRPSTTTQKPSTLHQKPSSLIHKFSTTPQGQVTQSPKPYYKPAQTSVTPQALSSQRPSTPSLSQKRPAGQPQKPTFAQKIPSNQKPAQTSTQAPTTDLEKSESMILISSAPSNSTLSVSASTQKVDAPTISIEITTKSKPTSPDDKAQSDQAAASSIHYLDIVEGAEFKDATQGATKLPQTTELSDGIMKNTQGMFSSQKTTQSSGGAQKNEVPLDGAQKTTLPQMVLSESTQKTTLAVDTTQKTTQIDELQKITIPLSDSKPTINKTMTTQIDSHKITTQADDNQKTTQINDAYKGSTQFLMTTVGSEATQKTTQANLQKTTLPYIFIKTTTDRDGNWNTTQFDNNAQKSTVSFGTTRRPGQTYLQKTTNSVLKDPQMDLYKTTQIGSSQIFDSTMNYEDRNATQTTAQQSTQYFSSASSIDSKTTSPFSQKTTSPFSQKPTSPFSQKTTSPFIQKTTSPFIQKTTSPFIQKTTSSTYQKTTTSSNQETTKPIKYQGTVDLKQTTGSDLETTPTLVYLLNKERPTEGFSTDNTQKNTGSTTLSIPTSSPTVTTFKPIHFTNKSTPKPLSISTSALKTTTLEPATTQGVKSESLPTLWELISTKNTPSNNAFGELQLDNNTPSSTYAPLSTFFWIHDGKSTTRSATETISTTKTSTAKVEVSTESAYIREKTPITSASTEMAAESTFSRLKLPNTSPNSLLATNDDDTLGDEVDYMDKLPVTDLLDQLLLSTTNIYEINTQLSENDTNRFGTTTQNNNETTANNGTIETDKTITTVELSENATTTDLNFSEQTKTSPSYTNLFEQTKTSSVYTNLAEQTSTDTMDQIINGSEQTKTTVPEQYMSERTKTTDGSFPDQTKTTVAEQKHSDITDATTAGPFLIKVSDPSEDGTSTTERNIMESIEKIISQAIGPVEPPVEHMKEAEDKIYEIISSSNNNKLMEKIQLEAATVASNLMDKNVDLEKQMLSESVDSLISQIVDQKPITIDTVSTTKANPDTEMALAREEIDLSTPSTKSKSPAEDSGTSTFATTIFSDAPTTSDTKQTSVFKSDFLVLENKEADDDNDHIRIIVTEPPVSSATEVLYNDTDFAERESAPTEDFKAASESTVFIDPQNTSTESQQSSATESPNMSTINRDTESQYSATESQNEVTKLNNGATETQSGVTEVPTTVVFTESTIVDNVETDGTTRTAEETFGTDSAKYVRQAGTESTAGITNSGVESTPDLKNSYYIDTELTTKLLDSFTSTQSNIPNTNTETVATESTTEPIQFVKITTQATRNNYSSVFANYKFVTESSFVDQNYLNPNDTNQTLTDHLHFPPSTQQTETNLKPENETEPETKTTWKLVSTLSPLEEPKPPQKQAVPRPVDLNAQPDFGHGLEDSRSKLDTDINRFIDLCNELSFGFWNSVTTGISTSRSVFVSPFAAISLLAMVFLGARGATSGEMNDILRLDDMVTFNPHLIFRNVSESIEVSKEAGVAASAIIRELYSDRGKGKLLPFYKERARQFYDGHVEEVSFKEIGDVIRRRTNLLVKRYTWGKISEYVKENTISVRPPLAGVSVSIFQTDCSAASTEGRDGELHFMVSPSLRHRRLVPIPAAVWHSNFLAGYDPNIDATAVSIGMKDEAVSTIFVMPGQQGISAPGDGLARLERHLVENSFLQGTWSQLLRSLIPRTGLEVQIPRFSHKSVLNATVALQRMGLKDLFSSDKADLRGLNGIAHELHLSDMVQVNNFAMCGENRIDDTHHTEVYPATSIRLARKLHHTQDDPLEEPRDYQRAFHDPLHDPRLLALPLPLRPRQARLPDVPRLRFDRPFLYFVRHNPTGLILHMGRFNPRLLP